MIVAARERQLFISVLKPAVLNGGHMKMEAIAV